MAKNYYIVALNEDGHWGAEYGFYSKRDADEEARELRYEHGRGKVKVRLSASSTVFPKSLRQFFVFRSKVVSNFANGSARTTRNTSPAAEAR